MPSVVRTCKIATITIDAAEVLGKLGARTMRRVSEELNSVVGANV